MSQFFTSGGQSIGASASASVLPMNIQGWFPLGWTGWIFLQSKGFSRVFSNTTIQKHQFFGAQLSSLVAKKHMKSCSIVSDSLGRHRLQHTRLPCLTSSPRACPASRPSSRWCHPAISSSVNPSPLPSIFSSIRVFPSESVLHFRWSKYWSFSFSINPFNECSGLISFRMDWFDLLAVQMTLKSLLQHHSSKVLIFGTQLSL